VAYVTDKLQCHNYVLLHGFAPIEACSDRQLTEIFYLNKIIAKVQKL